MVQPLTRFEARYIALPLTNIDTDQIIPARFLKVTDRVGLGKQAFCDLRYHADGAPKEDFVLNNPLAKGAQVLVAGDNFGCGSSREHAPWALLDAGFRAIISSRIADIFRNNALKNGLLPIELPPAQVQQLLAARHGSVVVDLQASEVVLPDGTASPFEVDSFARFRLLQGKDELEFLLDCAADMTAYEESHPCTP